MLPLNEREKKKKKELYLLRSRHYHGTTVLLALKKKQNKKHVCQAAWTLSLPVAWFTSHLYQSAVAKMKLFLFSLWGKLQARYMCSRALTLKGKDRTECLLIHIRDAQDVIGFPHVHFSVV